MVALIKRGFRSVTQTRAFAHFLSLLDKVDDRRPNVLRVLNYHRIDDPAQTPHLDPCTLSATPQAFAEHLELLASEYHVASIDEVLAAFAGKTTLPPRSVLITFDDAYRDFATHAWPELQRRGLPTVLFVPTAFVEHAQRAFWWDELYFAIHGSAQRETLVTPLGQFVVNGPKQRAAALRRLLAEFRRLPHARAIVFVRETLDANNISPPGHQVMDWATLKQLVREGLAIGAHTHTHPLMNRLTAEEIRSEIIQSSEILQQQLDQVYPVFAYPCGACNEQTVTILKEEGFQLAFTTRRGANIVSTAHPLLLRRINVGRAATIPLLQTQLALRPRWFNALCHLQRAR